MSDQEAITTKLMEEFQGAILGIEIFREEVTVFVKKEQILEIARYLKSDPDLSFNFLSLLCAVDYYPQRTEFEVVYHLYSLVHNHRIRLKVPVDRDSATIPSVTPVWSAANWHERETFDLMGIHFEGHPDLRRILLPDDWEGHPLRKDYALEGSEEKTEAETDTES